MMMWRRGRISAIGKSWGEADSFTVLLDDGREVRALAYRPQVGALAIDDDVLLSGATFERGLGTGGYMMIVAAPHRLPADPPPSLGHIVKARYTPMQYMVMGVDEQDSPYHDVLENADSISGLPVVLADLHSALAPIVVGIHHAAPAARIAYVMTDGAALPAWFSQVAWQLKESGQMLGTITCGQAYGGDLEAVNIHTALLAAKHVWNADVVVVAQGPGNLGTGTRWGFSGTTIGDAINAVDTLDGTAIACLRMSAGDKRDRHYGISHHTMRTVLDVAKVPAVLPYPQWDETDMEFGPHSDFGTVVRKKLAELAAAERLTLVRCGTAGVHDLLAASGFDMRTMGRGLDEDLPAFVAAACAGIYAGELHTCREDRRHDDPPSADAM